MQFRVDYFLVANGIYAAVNMHYSVVIEATKHVNDGVALANVGEELISQAFALAGTLHKSGYIYDVADCRHNATWVHEFGQFGQSFVGNRYLSQLRIDGAEGEIGSLSLCAREAIEEG